MKVFTNETNWKADSRNKKGWEAVVWKQNQ